MQRDVDREASIDREIEGDRLANQRLNQDRMSALKMRGGYKDRGIGMGPDDPGDVDDLYPDLREGLMYEGSNSTCSIRRCDTRRRAAMLAAHACSNNFKKPRVDVLTLWVKPSIKVKKLHLTSQLAET